MKTNEQILTSFKEKFVDIKHSTWRYPIDLDEVDKFLISHLEEARAEERNICREIFCEEVDWSEWARNKQEVLEDFDKARAARSPRV